MAATVLTFDKAEAAIAAMDPPPRLVAIDGLSLSGKSTLTIRLARRFRWAILGIDDFYLPEAAWPADVKPSVPFPFFRMDEFRAAVRSLHAGEGCSWRPIDWPTLTIQDRLQHIRPGRPVVVDGVSVLSPDLAPLYDLRIFVESDRETLVAAQKARDGENQLSDHWTNLFLPSVDLYMATRPQARADLIVAGRGWRP